MRQYLTKLFTYSGLGVGIVALIIVGTGKPLDFNAGYLWCGLVAGVGVFLVETIEVK